MRHQTDPELDPAYDDLHIGVALYDPGTGAVLDANDRLESVFGFATDELRDLSVGTCTANTHAFAEGEFLDRLRASADGETRAFVWRIKRGDGELVWVRLHLSRRASGYVAPRTGVLTTVTGSSASRTTRSVTLPRRLRYSSGWRRVPRTIRSIPFSAA